MYQGRHSCLAQQYRTCVPMYFCSEDNESRYPYIISDFRSGVQLAHVRNDPSWWTGARRKEGMLQSLFGHMVELASLEFDRICILSTVEDGGYYVAPFHALRHFAINHPSADAPFGPLDIIHVFLRTILDRNREALTLNSSFALAQRLLSDFANLEIVSPPFLSTSPPSTFRTHSLMEETGHRFDRLRIRRHMPERVASLASDYDCTRG